MRRLAVPLISTLLSFVASATAQPNGEWRDRRWHDHDHDRAYDRDDYRVPRDEWMTLARGVVLDEQRMVRIPLNDVPLRSVELQARRGGAEIVAVIAVYSDGSQEPFQIHRDLDARRAPNLRLDLPRGMRGVRALVVEGNGRVGFRVVGAR